MRWAPDSSSSVVTYRIEWLITEHSPSYSHTGKRNGARECCPCCCWHSWVSAAFLQVLPTISTEPESINAYFSEEPTPVMSTNCAFPVLDFRHLRTVRSLSPLSFNLFLPSSLREENFPDYSPSKLVLTHAANILFTRKRFLRISSACVRRDGVSDKGVLPQAEH